MTAFDTAWGIVKTEGHWKNCECRECDPENPIYVARDLARNRTLWGDDTMTYREDPDAWEEVDTRLAPTAYGKMNDMKRLLQREMPEYEFIMPNMHRYPSQRSYRIYRKLREMEDETDDSV
tara:strand:+ start:504 stop:866 length:363 start_codon:yes stop_codon:yes gene_type:complete